MTQSKGYHKGTSWLEDYYGHIKGSVNVGFYIAGIVAAVQCSVLGGRAAAAPCRAAQS